MKTPVTRGKTSQTLFIMMEPRKNATKHDRIEQKAPPIPNGIIPKTQRKHIDVHEDKWDKAIMNIRHGETATGTPPIRICFPPLPK